MKIRIAGLGLRLVAAVAALLGITYRAACADLPAAWDSLLANRPLAARAEFEKFLRAPNPRVAGEARRGLGMVARFLGQPETETQWNFDAFTQDHDTLAFLAPANRRYRFERSWWGHTLAAGYAVDKSMGAHPPLLTATLAAELALRLANDGDLQGAAKLEARLGLVRRWWAIGPFANISGSGFDQVYPPETAVQLDSAYRGKNGNTVRWFPLTTTPPTTWIFNQYHLPFPNAVLYFAAQIESPDAQQAWVSFGASGSFKVWVNDRLVLADKVFRNTGEDAFAQPVALHRGPNRILVKLGNDSRYSNFQLRLLDAGGRGLADFKETDPRGAYAHDTGVVADLQNSPNLARALDYLRARLEKNPGDADAALLRMDVFNVNEMTDSAEVWGLRQLALHPRSALWLSLLSESMTRSGQVTRSQAYLKSAYRNSPYCYAGWMQELTRLSKSAGPEMVLDFLAKSPPEFRQSQTALWASIVKLGELGRKADALNQLAELERVPEFDVVTAALLAGVYKAQGRKDDALQIWKKFTDFRHTDGDAYREAANLDIGAGEVAQASAWLRTGSEFSPDNPNLPITLANLEMQNKQYDAAQKDLDHAEALAPTHPAVLGLKANLLFLRGRRQEARSTLLQSIDYNYNDFDAWDKLLEIDGQPTFESLAPLPSVDSLLQASRGWEGLQQERGALVAYLHDVFFYPSRAVRTRTFLVAHLTTAKAVDNWKEYDIPYNATYQSVNVVAAHTRKASGEEIDAEVRGTDVVFKSLEPGDAVVLEWTDQDDYDGDMARQCWGRFQFRLSLPTFFSRLRLYTAGRDTIGYHIRGADIRFTAGESSGVKMRSFARGPYLVSPKDWYLPINDSTAPDVLYSTFSNWGQIADWYADITEDKSAPVPIVQRLADSLFRGAGDDAEKVRRVQRFVASVISYSSLPFRQSGWIPQPAQEVLASRLGDCKDKSALAKSLLALAGIPSHLVLVATRDEFDTRPGPIGPHFNHCLLAYTLQGRERYLELTDPYLYYTRLAKDDQGATALVIRRGNRTLMRLPVDGPDDRTSVRTVQCVLDDSGNAAIATHSVRTGLFARSIRSGYRFLSPEEQKTELRRSLLDDYTDVDVDSVHFGDLDAVTDSVQYVYGFTARQTVAASGATRIFRLFLPDKVSSQEIPDDARHAEGLDLYQASYSIGRFDQTGRIVYPKRWKLLDVPAPLHVRGPGGEYSLVFKVKGNTVSYRRQAVFRAGEPIPATQAKAARDFLTRIARADDVQLVFRSR